MNRCQIFLRWSDEDSAFIAEVPELPGCMAHGESQDEALHHAQEAIAAWIEMAQEIGRPIPEPRGRLMHA
ncbi:MAG: type II toxin-antitoxin system HicB family antitoxin [Thiobacillus sp.]|nr:type II toxin-antitoxin system HicB family antitoxin [Thiobacillus sp.]MDP2977915.1 type II toxin-antitoxin system HicB family antitoxin [Thiobacillus sp.]